VTHEHRVVIVGAGFSGIGMAARLRSMGIEDFVVLDRGTVVLEATRADTASAEQLIAFMQRVAHPAANSGAGLQ